MELNNVLLPAVLNVFLNLVFVGKMTANSIHKLTMTDDWFDKEIVYFSRLKPISSENGGFRRVAQLVCALDDLDFAIVSAVDHYDVCNRSLIYRCATKLELISSGFSNLFTSLMRNYSTHQVYGKWAEGTQDNYYKLFFISCVWRDVLKERGTKLKLAIIDDPIYFAPLIEYLSELKVPIVAHCHNIETLSTSQVVYESQPELFKYELDILRKCSFAIAISYEECFLLNNVGVSSFYFPYYPVKSIRTRMGAIREVRKSTAKRDYLLLGTALNPPTLHGMLNVLNSWQTFGKESADRLIVAGFGTAHLADCCSLQHGVIFKGALDDSELDEILSTCKGTLIYQEHGSGALTKICEYLCAGVPVLVNFHAARSYHNLPGVLEYESLGQMLSGIAVADIPVENVYLPEMPDAQPLLNKIRLLSEQFPIRNDI